MKRLSLTDQDKDLVAAAIKASKVAVRQLWDEKSHALVTAAVRLDNGDIITARNITADVGSLSQCAEPSAILEANLQTDRSITAIVAVYHDPGHEPKVIPPCGRCREFITDYARNAFVIIREPNTDDIFKVKADDLLPYKYGDFWNHRVLT
ncbi:MAG: cytidine deaminase [Alphaproteobacteria bacterium]|nr:cytidine deaminase [Alphaproteobacteria bacterium]